MSGRLYRSAKAGWKEGQNKRRPSFAESLRKGPECRTTPDEMGNRGREGSRLARWLESARLFTGVMMRQLSYGWPCPAHQSVSEADVDPVLLVLCWA